MTSSSTGDAGAHTRHLYVPGRAAWDSDELIALGPRATREYPARLPASDTRHHSDARPVGRELVRRNDGESPAPQPTRHRPSRGLDRVCRCHRRLGELQRPRVRTIHGFRSTCRPTCWGPPGEGDRLVADARPIHAGRTTQVFDVEITRVQVPGAAGSVIARVTCTQLILADRGLCFLIDLDQRTVPHVLARGARLWPDRSAVADIDRELTYAQLHDSSHRVAGGLADLGVSAGDRVALLLDNGIAHVLSWFAASLRNAMEVPLNTALP